MKKHHKLQRHKDSNHKRPKTKKHHKHKKEHPVSESVLEPIPEASREKVKVDKNACGDYVTLPKFKDDQKKKSKHEKKSEKTDKVEKLRQEEVNIFTRNYLQKIKASTNEKLVRHHSLEKSGDSLINKTKHLFRKEKSFNDAVQNVSKSNEENKKEIKRRHNKGKNVKSAEVKENKEKHKINEKSCKKCDKEGEEDKVKDKEKKAKTSTKRRPKSKEKSPVDGKTMYNRVQEVIYCQLDQVPYKLKNDKSGAEIKNLYQRIKKEKRRDKGGDRTKSQEQDSKKMRIPEKHMKEGNRKERSKSVSKQLYEENILNVEKKRRTHSRDHDSKDKHHKRHCQEDQEDFPEKSSKRSDARKNNKVNLSNIDLGPFHKYFAFEKKHTVEHKKDEELGKAKESSKEKKHREHSEHITCNLDYDNARSKRHLERHEDKTELVQENKHKTDEDKIHKIVEGDLKSYFTKIQNMIDQKLDAILHISKSRHESISNTKLKEENKLKKRSKSRTRDKLKKEEPYGRSKSKTRDKLEKKERSGRSKSGTRDKLEKEERSGSKKADRRKKVDLKKHNSTPSKDENLIKEEIIQEVMQRIKNEARRDPLLVAEKESKAKTDKIGVMKQESNENAANHQDVAVTKKSSSKRHHECPKILEQNNQSSSRKSSCRKHHHKELTRLPDAGDYEQTEPFRKQRSPESRNLPRDSLTYMKNRGSPPPQQVTAASADISSFESERHSRTTRRYKNPYSHAIFSRAEEGPYNLKKHYTSASSCIACSEHHLESTVAEIYHNGNKTHREQDLLDQRRNSPPEKMRNGINSGVQAVISRPEDYIMAPPEPRKPKLRVREYAASDRYKESSRRRSMHSVVVQYIAPSLENLILPPDMFRTPERRLDSPREEKHYQERLRSPERQHPKQEFVVQGIEPPILECPKQNSRGQRRTRNLECKTVSIVGIPPQIMVKGLPLANQTQTRKLTTPDRDLVEKRKRSKRFRLYYKYSVVNNSKEDQDSGSSDARSIVSDSYKVISDPSEESAMVYSRGVKETREKHIALELSQALNTAQKKWNRITTPRDSHLNNIIEEPSNMSNSIKNDEYFIPIRGADECYFRALTSSHSEYCFKIHKKPANSNISLLSKDTCDGRYRYYENGRCRYCKHDIRSKSDINVGSNCHGLQIFKSKSDVFLGGASGRKVIRSIFLEDSHPYVKSRRPKVSYNPNPGVQNVFNRKDINRSTCKDSQTSEVKVNVALVGVDEEENKFVFKDKQRQFKDIYKTINDLEENIQSSRRAPPRTLDVAISSKFMSLDKISDKKPQFKEIYKTINNLENKMIHIESSLVKKVDVAIGSVVKIQSKGSSKSEPRKTTLEAAVSDSRDQVKTGHKSESRGRRLKSTGVSPIRVLEDLQNSSKSPTRKNITTISPNIRPYVIRPLIQRQSRNIPEDSTLKKRVLGAVETKNDTSSLKPKILVVKNTKVKSPERTQIRNEQAIKELRSQEKGTNVKIKESTGQNRPRDAKPIENICKAVNETTQAHESRQHCTIVNVLEDSKPIINASTNNTPTSNKLCVRKCTPREKGDVPKRQPFRNHVDDVPKSCVHHYNPRELHGQKASKTATASGKTAGVIKMPITVNTALCKSRPAILKETLPERSTSSSLGDDSLQNIRRSRSLVEIRTKGKNLNISKSEIINKDLVICNSRDLQTNGGSIAMSGNMEKFTNVPRLRCQSSQSQVHSLDQFIGHKFTSRLLLTKDYKGGEMSAYQRRKLYDQSIRQRMKKKFRFSKLNVGPQIFEVRFLSMVNQESDHRKEREARVKHYLERPIITLNLEKAEKEGPVKHKEDYNPNDNKVCGVSDQGIVNTNIVKEDLVCNKSDHCNNDVLILTSDLLSAANKRAEIYDNNDKEVLQKTHIKVECSVTELYFKDGQVNQENLLSFCNKLLEVNSSLVLPEGFKGEKCTCTKFSKNCEYCNNFVNLLNILCSSVALYCDSRTELIDDVELEDDFKPTNDQSKDGNETINVYNAAQDFDSLHVHFPNLEFQETSNNLEEIYSCRGNNNTSCESTEQSDKMFRNIVECGSLATTNRTHVAPSLSQPLSCPILPTNTTSFEFLYEESSTSDDEGISREIVLANLTRPFDQNFNFSMSQYNVETPFIQRNSPFSATGSLESGYASIRSKSCIETSLARFFKKPNIAALFKPPVLVRSRVELSKSCGLKSQYDLKKSILYKEMTKNCQLYAKKVRESSELKSAKKVDEYQEFPLTFLLGTHSSIVLESTALRQESSAIVASFSNEDDAITEELIESDINKKNDDISSVGDDFSQSSEIPFVENGCRLVLSNDCLKIDSFTYVGAEIFNEDLKYKLSKESERYFEDASKNDCDITSVKYEGSSFTLDSSLDSNNPFVPCKDALTQKFLGSLLKVYQKELEFSKDLFKDDDFLKNVLLPAVKERKNEEKRNKRGMFSRFFRKKLQDHQANSDEYKPAQASNIQVKASARLQSLASNAKKCFTMLAEAVKINENIDDEIKICGLLKLLERIENGDFYMMKNEVDSTIEHDIKSQVKDAFVNIYEICKKEAKRTKRNIGFKEINLINGFISKYRIGLLSKTDIVACCIGGGVIQTEAQLKAAVTYLVRSKSSEVNFKEFKEYCNFPKSTKK